MAVFGHLRLMFVRHHLALRRVGVAVLATALGLLVAGGTIRVLRAADRDPPRPAATATPSAEWTAALDAPVTGLALDDGRVYVSSSRLGVFPVSCVESARGCAPRWHGATSGGPLSAPTVQDDRVFVGSSDGRLFAFASTCGERECLPEWVGDAGSGQVSRPAANFDLVYVTSEELSAFPVGCASDDEACPPAWTARVPGRPADGPPALGGGLVIVGSSSTRGGVVAFPAACRDGCEPAWTGRTEGPASAVAADDTFAYTVARGQLLAFPLSCTGRCKPEWRAPFVPGAQFATGATSAPAVADGLVFVGDDDGHLWVFRAGCDTARCTAIARFDVSTSPLYTPVIDGDLAIVTTASGAVARVRLDCGDDEDCRPVRVRLLDAEASAPALLAPETTIVGTDDGTLESFAW